MHRHELNMWARARAYQRYAPECMETLASDLTIRSLQISLEKIPRGLGTHFIAYISLRLDPSLLLRTCLLPLTMSSLVDLAQSYFRCKLVEYHIVLYRENSNQLYRK